jgi:hypothetical protein
MRHSDGGGGLCRALLPDGTGQRHRQSDPSRDQTHWKSENRPHDVEHIDLDISGIIRREITIPQAGDMLIDMVKRTANGRLTAAEALGHREYVLTKLYRSA